MDIPAALLAAFPPSQDALLDFARRHIDDSMLMEIARADYGGHAGAHLAALRPIRDTGILSSPMHWQPGEVLELTSYCDPDSPEAPPFEPGPTGQRGHMIRLFACAVLLRGDASSSSDMALAACLRSCKALGEEWSALAARFLTWRIPQLEIDDERLLFVIGLLILAARLRSGRLSDTDLNSAADWALEEESNLRQTWPPDPANRRPMPFSVQSGFWQPLATELTDEGTTINTGDVADKLQLCALLVESG